MATGIEQIARRDDGIHERIGKGFFAASGRKMIYDSDSLRSAQTILSREKIATDDFDAGGAADLVGIFCEFCRIAALGA